jgi:hypothetical protein
MPQNLKGFEQSGPQHPVLPGGFVNPPLAAGDAAPPQAAEGTIRTRYLLTPAG